MPVSAGRAVRVYTHGKSEYDHVRGSRGRRSTDGVLDARRAHWLGVDGALGLVWSYGGCHRGASPRILRLMSSAAIRVDEKMHDDSSSYDQFMGRWSRRIAPSLVAFAGVADGDRVLDIGSGTGALASAVLGSAPTTCVVGVDVATPYLEKAREELGGERASFQEGDAQDLGFADGVFDKTLSLLAFNFIPHPGRALDEMIRVTKPGGVIAAAVWDYGEGMEMLRIFWDEAVALDPASESSDERHMQLCRSGELGALWREHSLADVKVTSLVIELPFTSVDDYWAPFLAGQGPAGSYVASLADDHRQALERRVGERLHEAHGDRSFELSARAWAARGTTLAGPRVAS